MYRLTDFKSHEMFPRVVELKKGDILAKGKRNRQNQNACFKTLFDVLNVVSNSSSTCQAHIIQQTLLQIALWHKNCVTDVDSTHIESWRPVKVVLDVELLIWWGVIFPASTLSTSPHHCPKTLFVKILFLEVKLRKSWYSLVKSFDVLSVNFSHLLHFEMRETFCQINKGKKWMFGTFNWLWSFLTKYHSTQDGVIKSQFMQFMFEVVAPVSKLKMAIFFFETFCAISLFSKAPSHKIKAG